jgi:hypothetical protein
MRSRAKLCAALLSVVVGMAVLPMATAAAASAELTKSSICKVYKSEEAKEAKASAALQQKIQSQSWASIKKALLAEVNGDKGAENQFAGYLSGASAKVRAAVAVVLKLDGSFKAMIERSTSLTGYESGITAAESSPKVKAALALLAAYTSQLCGTATTTT